ncbi:protein SMG8 isoform X1 [Pararge aegeria]|nr:protein SMG8 isoform X1 [Pararge aegeria]
MTNIFSISDIPEFSKKDRIVVVGVIGKSPYRYPNKTSPLLPAVHCEENGIECHWDERKSILYLHAVTYLDTKRLVSLASELDEDSKSTVKDADAAHWLVASGELAMESCRAIALIFHLCHIVVLSSPTPVFDLGYLQLFKAVDGYRAELIAATTEALLRSAAGGAWDTHGRPCCPRLLFHFRRAPAPLRRAPAALKRLEHSVEDQIYFILRKARIITNVCAKSLFAIPKNEEFVYMSSDADTGNARDVSSLIRGLVHLCTGTEPDPAPQRSFRQFLQSHLDLAFGEGFDDNVGKYAMSTSFFELPSASSWRAAARALAPIYLQSPPPEAQEAGGALFDALATDVRFSQARCAKVLPIAQASYAEGLPAHYSSQHHVHKVGVALGVVEAMARGPLAGAARARLTAACAATWRTRTLCEAPSLTGHPCTHPHHDSSKEHSSGVRYISACNCGRTKCSREDPYTVKQANYTFYTYAAEECGVCNTLQSIEFPIFQPSTPSFRAASVKGAVEANALAEDKEVEQEEESEAPAPPSPTSPRSSWSPPDELSPGSAADEEEDEPAACSDAGIELVTVQEPSAPAQWVVHGRESDQPAAVHHGVPARHAARGQPGGPAARVPQLGAAVPGRVVAVLAQRGAARAPAARLPAAHQLPAALGLRRARRAARRPRPRARQARALPHRQDLHRLRVRVSARPQVHDVVAGQRGVGRRRVGARDGRGAGGRRAPGLQRHAAAGAVPVPRARAGAAGAPARRHAQGVRARHAGPQGAAGARAAGVHAAGRWRGADPAERVGLLGAAVPAGVRGRARLHPARALARHRHRAGSHVRPAGVSGTPCTQLQPASRRCGLRGTDATNETALPRAASQRQRSDSFTKSGVIAKLIVPQIKQNPKVDSNLQCSCN